MSTVDSLPDFTKFDKLYTATRRFERGGTVHAITLFFELDETVPPVKQMDGREYIIYRHHLVAPNVKGVDAIANGFVLLVRNEAINAGWSRLVLDENGDGWVWGSPHKPTEPSLEVTWPKPFLWPACPPKNDGRYLALVNINGDLSWRVRWFVGGTLENKIGEVVAWLPLPPTEIAEEQNVTQPN